MMSQLKYNYLPPSFSWLGLQDYVVAMEKIQTQVHGLRTKTMCEHVFCCEHRAIYTTGRRKIDNRQQAELPAPLLLTDRGGETTFHGPKQLMFYPVIHLAKRGLSVSCYVSWLEKSCITLCATFGVEAYQRQGFPGVWVANHKLAAIGLRVRHGIVYHGMALNVDVEPTWFDAISGCGLSTQMVNLNALTGQTLTLEQLGENWYNIFCTVLGEGCGTI